MKRKHIIKLRILRIKANKTQSDIANMLGIDRSTIAKYEIGSREPDLATLCKIADVLQVTVDELLDR